MTYETSLLSLFEQNIISQILEKDAPDLLAQLSQLRVESREHTGVGTYVNFCYEGRINGLDGDDRTLGMHIFSDIKGIDHGAGFVLYVDTGLISMLEIFSHAGEEMPCVIEAKK